MEGDSETTELPVANARHHTAYSEAPGSCTLGTCTGKLKKDARYLPKICEALGLIFSNNKKMEERQKGRMSLYKTCLMMLT